MFEDPTLDEKKLTEDMQTRFNELTGATPPVASAEVKAGDKVQYHLPDGKTHTTATVASVESPDTVTLEGYAGPVSRGMSAGQWEPETA